MKNIYTVIVLVLIVTACNQKQEATADVAESDVQRVLDHHWEAFTANDLEKTMEDYSEESVLITPTATHQGLEQIRANFANVFKRFPKDSTTFNLQKSLVVKDVGYILWNSKTPTFNLTYGTDTFIIRDGKIVRQTFAGIFE